jgi:ABC-type multidrug transport system fused ATPase/permease subunit
MRAMPVRVLLGYLGHHRTRYAGGVVLLFATTLSALAIPWVIKGTIEAVAEAGGLRNASGPAGARAAVATGALLVVGLAALQGASRAASRFCLLGASQRVEARIRDDLFGRLLRLPPAFYQAQRTGDLQKLMRDYAIITGEMAPEEISLPAGATAGK